MPAPIEYIEDQAGLLAVIDACMDKPAIAVDTEFARTSTYYPMVGLIQIYNGETCYLIDPLSVTDLSPLTTLLTAPDVIKVFHACSEDMEVFQHSLGVVPTPLFDTQIAVAALGVGFSLSYQNMVEHYLSINVPKEETRSDWLQRPLTKSQLDYAALDVIYLQRVYEQLVAELALQGRDGWVTEECAHLSDNLATMIEPEDFYKKMKGLWKFNRKQLSVLRALCAWREVEARYSNVPRNRIIDQKSLLSIAAENVQDKKGLQRAEGVSPRQVRKYGDDLLLLAVEARKLPEEHTPHLVLKDSTRINSKLLGTLRTLSQSKAETLSIAPELLTKRRYLEQLLISGADSGKYELPRELSGWRQSVIGDELLEALK